MKEQVAVLGFGVTGESVVRHLLRQGMEPVVLDTRPARAVPFSGVEFHWEAERWPGLDVSRAVVSPGLDLDACLVAGARDAGVQLLSDIDLFFDAVDVPVIGITGTNGKSTVTSLTGHLLNYAGKSCGVGGNLGEAALDIIDDDHECYVLELSSFQLERSAEHPFHAATILNVSEDHLDKHSDMADYTASKQRIYVASGYCVYNRDDGLTRPAADAPAVSFGPDEPPGAEHWGLREDAGARYLSRGHDLVCAAQALPLAGAHNEQNALAACALVRGWVSDETLAPALASFKGLPHRFETVARLQGVTFVNDSKATNLGATVAALAGMPADNQVVLIAGGDAKGVDLSPLAVLFAGRVKYLVTLGMDGPQLMDIAATAGVDAEASQTMPDAVAAAWRAASPQDTVLLSPACASLDMFDNFAARGAAFSSAVRGLVGADSGVER